MSKTVKKVNPMRITDPKTNEVYVLEFSRDTVRFAERRGFKIAELLDFPETNIRELFFLAFRKNHPSLSRAEIDEIFDELDGLFPEEIERLSNLYSVPMESLIIDKDNTDARKNARLTVEL